MDWRSPAKHHAAQVAGRQRHFEDYRLRIAELVCEWLPEPSELRRLEAGGSHNESVEQRFLIASTASQQPAAAEGEVLASVYRESEYIVLASASSLAAGHSTVDRLALTGTMTSVRMYLVWRDYGMYDRTEAPQSYPPVERTLRN